MTLMATLKPEPVFTLVVGTEAFAGMRKVGEWEGFVKLQGEAGIAILCDNRGPMARSIDTVFDLPYDGWVIVRASPAILAAVPAEEQRT